MSQKKEKLRWQWVADADAVRPLFLLFPSTTDSAKYQRLVETERLYYKTVRDYEDEIKKNEKLLARAGGAA